jgi:hypothetical protein
VDVDDGAVLLALPPNSTPLAVGAPNANPAAAAGAVVVVVVVAGVAPNPNPDAGADVAVVATDEGTFVEPNDKPSHLLDEV